MIDLLIVYETLNEVLRGDVRMEIYEDSRATRVCVSHEVGDMVYTAARTIERYDDEESLTRDLRSELGRQHREAFMRNALRHIQKLTAEAC